jgi:tRNA-splicing ligase RtcB
MATKTAELTLERLDANRWRIPKESRPDMRVDGIVYASDKLMAHIRGEQALVQVANVATLPGIVKASLAMPDIHWGYGFCIGGVAATDVEEGGVVSPGGVGYDINCGVRLLRTDLTEKQVQPLLKDLVDQLFRDVPAGVGEGGPFTFPEKQMRQICLDGSRYLAEIGLASSDDLEATEGGGRVEGADPDAVSETAFRRGLDQCGTLGSGNHFAEIQVVEEVFDEPAAAAMGLAKGLVTLMIHSGSRGFGYQICEDAIRALRKVPQRLGIVLPDPQLVCAPVKSPEGQRYLGAMRAAANFAWANRQLLAHLVGKAVARASRTAGALPPDRTARVDPRRHGPGQFRAGGHRDGHARKLRLDLPRGRQGHEPSCRHRRRPRSADRPGTGPAGHLRPRPRPDRPGRGTAGRLQGRPRRGRRRPRRRAVAQGRALAPAGCD